MMDIIIFFSHKYQQNNVAINNIGANLTFSLPITAEKCREPVSYSYLYQPG